jgi:hypothetical protein
MVCILCLGAPIPSPIQATDKRNKQRPSITGRIPLSGIYNIFFTLTAVAYKGEFCSYHHLLPAGENHLVFGFLWR